MLTEAVDIIDCVLCVRRMRRTQYGGIGTWSERVDPHAPMPLRLDSAENIACYISASCPSRSKRVAEIGATDRTPSIAWSGIPSLSFTQLAPVSLSGIGQFRARGRRHSPAAPSLCAGLTGKKLLCWNFSAKIMKANKGAAQARASNTCNGDSGGGLFMWDREEQCSVVVRRKKGEGFVQVTVTQVYGWAVQKYGQPVESWQTY